MCGVGAKSVAHLMKFHLLQWEVIILQYVRYACFCAKILKEIVYS